MISLDVWSDLVCPWCYIGKRRLERALALLPAGEKVNVRWRAYELRPDMPVEGVEAKPMYIAKFGGEQRMKLLFDRVSQVAAGEGLAFALDKVERAPNTFLAHRVVKAAEEQGHGEAAMAAIFSGHFEHGVYIGEYGSIEAWLKQRGVPLDFEKLRERLDAGAFADEVRADEREAAELGVQGVPFFLGNRRVALSGAGEPEHLARLIEAAAEQAQGRAAP